MSYIFIDSIYLTTLIGKHTVSKLMLQHVDYTCKMECTCFETNIIQNFYCYNTNALTQPWYIQVRNELTKELELVHLNGQTTAYLTYSNIWNFMKQQEASVKKSIVL